MYTGSDIMRALGRIEGELVEIRKLSERVSKLEQWQSWLKGGWAALGVALGYRPRRTSVQNRMSSCPSNAKVFSTTAAGSKRSGKRARAAV